MLFVFAENPEVVDSQLLTAVIFLGGCLTKVLLVCIYPRSWRMEQYRSASETRCIWRSSWMFFFLIPENRFSAKWNLRFSLWNEKIKSFIYLPRNQWLEDDISFWDGLFSKVMPVSESVTLSILGFHVSFEGCKCLLNLRLCLVSISAFFHTFLFTGPLPGWLDEVKRMELWKMRAKLERGKKRRLYHDQIQHQ